MAATYNTGSLGAGWYNPDTGRQYSRADERAAQQQIDALLQRMGGGNPFGMLAPPIAPATTTTAPQIGAPGYIADPGNPFAQQIASGQRAAPSVYQPYYNQAAAPQAGSGGLLTTPGPQVTAQDRVNARAQARADARLQNELRTPTSLADLFGVGDGDWASQWGRLQKPGSSQYAGYSPAGGLNDLMGAFNSASGPYGQMQAAAAYTAPARNDRQARMYEADTSRDIAKMKYSTANRVLSNLANLMQGGQQMNGFETDYGASAMLRPTNLKRFF